MYNCNNCCEIVCEESTFIHYCSDGFFVYFDLPDNTTVYATIEPNRIRVKSTVINKTAFFEFKPSQWFSKKKVELHIVFKTAKGEPVLITHDDCKEYCGIIVNVEPYCEDSFTGYLNGECAPEMKCCIVVAIQKCCFEVELKKCCYIIEEKVEHVNIGGKIFPLSHSPVIFNAGVPSINTDFVTELNQIENGTWDVTLVGSTLSICHIGTDADFYDGCKNVEKVCQPI